MRLQDYLEEIDESQAIFGKRVGVTQSAVAQWFNGGRVDAEKVLRVCAATNWLVRPFDLRPDLYPDELDGMPRDPAEKRAA